MLRGQGGGELSKHELTRGVTGVTGLSRDEALEVARQEGVVLVLCSLLENLPYVVAEAAAMNIPFLVRILVLKVRVWVRVWKRGEAAALNFPFLVRNLVLKILYNIPSGLGRYT
jgi:hypothetical protein